MPEGKIFFGVPIVIGGHNLPAPVGIGLTNMYYASEPIDTKNNQQSIVNTTTNMISTVNDHSWT